MSTSRHFQTLLVSQQGSTRWITLNRPERRNRLIPEMLSELSQALADARGERGIRVLAIAAAGPDFCTGADLGDSPEGGPPISELAQGTDLFSEIEDFPQPVIGLAHGLTCAGGLELLLACDLIIAASDARFADLHSNAGLIPGAGGAFRLARRVGISMAKWMIYSGNVFSAAEMQQAGLVSQVLPPAELKRGGEALTTQLGGKSPLSLAATKRLINAANTDTRDHAMRESLKENERYSTSSDYREGLDALAERRRPLYTGS